MIIHVRWRKTPTAEGTGVSTYNANLETQKVNVDLDSDSKVHYDEVYEKIKKTGKKISSGKEFDSEGKVVRHVEYDGEGNGSVVV